MPRLCSYAAVVVVVGVCLVGGRGACANHADDIIDLDDAHRSVPELIARHNYPVEVHTVTTSDGYILEMHRIPHGRDSNKDTGPDKPAALVIHGLISSSADFILTGPSKALGYILAEAGFDVWLGNCRGNTYSRRHTSNNPNTSNSFWSFSFEECGTIDVQRKIDYILSVTGKSALHYIGHSQGTTAMIALCSLKPEYNAKIKSAQLMAPVASLEHMDAPTLSVLANFANELLNTVGLFGTIEAFPRGTMLRMENGQAQCNDNGIMTIFCQAMLPAFANQDPDQFNQELMPVLIGHTPAGASLKQFAHYGQMMSDGDFCRWSHTTAIQNLFAYGTFRAPQYPLNRITVPMSLWYSRADILTPEQDVLKAHARMPTSVLRLVPEENFTHFDFAWGTRAKEIVYNDVIASMWQHES